MAIRRRSRGGPQRTQGPFDALRERLRREPPVLNDNGRELILESAFGVVCADGECPCRAPV